MITTDYSNAAQVVDSLTKSGKALVIIQGVPGSGKSTLARELQLFNFHVAEADDYFISPFDGKYKHCPAFIAEAHKRCQGEVGRLLYHFNRVAVANTNLTDVEIKPYLTIARRHYAETVIVRLTQEFGSVHDVPSDVMEDMRNKQSSYKIDVLVKKGGAR